MEQIKSMLILLAQTVTDTHVPGGILRPVEIFFSQEKNLESFLLGRTSRVPLSTSRLHLYC